MSPFCLLKLYLTETPEIQGRSNSFSKQPPASRTVSTLPIWICFNCSVQGFFTLRDIAINKSNILGVPDKNVNPIGIDFLNFKTFSLSTISRLISERKVESKNLQRILGIPFFYLHFNFFIGLLAKQYDLLFFTKNHVTKIQLFSSHFFSCDHPLKE